MDVEKLRAALKRAQSVVPQLGQAADQLNASFTDLEQALRATNLRIPVRVVLYEEHDDTFRPIGATYLGWTKLDGTWSLAISSEYLSGPPTDDSIRVTAASLRDRKVAAGKVHLLVEAMAEAMLKQVAQLKAASAQVDEVTSVLVGDES